MKELQKCEQCNGTGIAVTPNSLGDWTCQACDGEGWYSVLKEVMRIDTSEIQRELGDLLSQARRGAPTLTGAAGLRVTYGLAGAVLAVVVAVVLAGQGCLPDPMEREAVFIERTHTVTVQSKDERVEQLQRELATARTALSTWERRTVRPVVLACDGGAPVIGQEVVDEKGTDATREERREVEAVTKRETKTKTRTEETRDVELRTIERPVLPSWGVGLYGGAQLGPVVAPFIAATGGYRIPFKTARASLWVDGLFMMQVPTATTPLKAPALGLGLRGEF